MHPGVCGEYLEYRAFGCGEIEARTVVEEVEEVCVKDFPRMTKLMNDGHKQNMGEKRWREDDEGWMRTRRKGKKMVC